MKVVNSPERRLFENDSTNPFDLHCKAFAVISFGGPLALTGLSCSGTEFWLVNWSLSVGENPKFVPSESYPADTTDIRFHFGATH
jgi:hypothetical protein